MFAGCKQYVLGLDMGGTNSVLGLVNQQGEVLARTGIKTYDYPDINDYVAALYEGARSMTAPFGGLEQVQGIGAGVPNGNYYTGEIQQAVNLPWHDVPFARVMSERFGLPCTITNDANAAALGEMKYGAAKGMKNFIEITLGTGVGSGIVIDGKVVYGHDGFAGELGHTCAVRGKEARACNCGKTGCLEAYTSATGVARTAKEMLQTTHTPSLLRELAPDKITSYDVFCAAEKGDKIAQDIFALTGEILGRQLSDFVAFSAPEAIILFGGLAKAGHWILDPVVKAMNDNMLPLWKNKVKVLFSTLKDADAAILGASALAW